MIWIDTGNRMSVFLLGRVGGDTMTVFESLSLMINFGTLIAILAFHKK